MKSAKRSQDTGLGAKGPKIPLVLRSHGYSADSKKPSAFFGQDAASNALTAIVVAVQRCAELHNSSKRVQFSMSPM